MAGKRGSGKIIELTVDEIGARGDGVAREPDGPVYLPFTLPGDRVRARVGRDGRAEIIERLEGGERPADGRMEDGRIEDGRRRRDPDCRHFGQCGGCALQHAGPVDYMDWKRTLVVDALARRGIEADVTALVQGSPGSRRRVRLAARILARGVVLGFRERRSNQIVDLSECSVATPGIVDAIAALRPLLGEILPSGEQAEISMTHAESGLDILIRASVEPDLAVRERLVRFAEDRDLARISWAAGGETAQPVAARRRVRVSFRDVEADLPPESFLQPTVEGEEALRTEVIRALAGARRVADLFSGCGAFGLPLAKDGAALLAVDGDAAAVAALDAAARRGGFGEHIRVETRDLDQRPLLPAELKKLDGVILDPPRAGAAAQAAALAESGVPVVAYASCNPGTFARDARTLIDGGYGLEGVTPVDQFLWSPHVELVGMFRR